MNVVDTNVLAYLLLPGPRTAQAEALLMEDGDWAAPLLWRSEWRNVLAGYIRRGLLALPQALALLEQAEALLGLHELAVASEAVMLLVAASRCSAYDCEFVAAAQQLGVPLVTADRALLQAFAAVARPLPFAAGDPSGD